MEGEIMIDLPQTRSISLKSYIEDIKKSIKDGNYLSVLCISLIIPDICINYLDWDNKDGKGYKKWVDKYITESYLPSTKYNSNRKRREIDDIKFDGKACYSLRCSILHEGTTPLETKLLKTEGIKKYKTIQLCVNSKSNLDYQYGESKSLVTSPNHKEYSMRINVVNFAKEMIDGCNKFLEEEKIDDIRLFTMIDWDNRNGEIIFTPNE